MECCGRLSATALAATACLGYGFRCVLPLAIVPLVIWHLAILPLAILPLAILPLAILPLATIPICIPSMLKRTKRDPPKFPRASPGVGSPFWQGPTVRFLHMFCRSKINQKSDSTKTLPKSQKSDTRTPQV